MWTLLLIAIAAILWLLQFTVGQDSGMPSAGIARALFLAAWGVTAIASVQVLQYGFTSWLVGQRGTHAASDLLRAVVRILLYVVAAGLFLHFALGQAITGLLATSAMLSVIIGLALQPTLGHLFSGVSIEIERPLHVGDFIRRGELEGQVTSLNWRSVFIRTERGSRIVMPNSDFTSHTVEIIDGKQPFRESAVFDLASTVTPGKVMRIAMRVLRSDLPHVCRDPEPSVIMLGTEPRSGSVRYVAYFYTHNFLERNHVASAVLERLWYALSREGLQLMPPQRFGNNSVGAGNTTAAVAPVAQTSQPSPLQNNLSGDKAAWMTLLRAAFPGLSSPLVEKLASNARRYRYGQYEKVSSGVAAFVVSGRLREQCVLHQEEAEAALQRVLRLGPESVDQDARIPRDKLDRILVDATQAIGPLAQSLVAGYAAVTDDLWLMYKAIAMDIADAERRAAFIALGPAAPTRGLTAGDLFGWAHSLDPASAASPCHATQDCELLVWNEDNLRKTLKSAEPEELQKMLALLRGREPACRRLDAGAVLRRLDVSVSNA